MLLLKKMMLAGVFMLAGTALSAQNIRGIVRDAMNRQPLAGATIQQKGTENGVSADADGRFSITLQPNATSQLEIRFLGYRADVLNASPDMSVFLYPETVVSEAVFVQASRADERLPISFTTVKQQTLEEQNLGKDLPFIVQYAPSVVQTSDAGTGIGYTSLRIRGVDPTRINVTINGVPLNDPESQNVFWVNTPDLAASTGSVQLQRGVGTSTNGNAAFGASMNVETAAARPEAYGQVTLGGGSFATRRFNALAGTGTRNGINLEARVSYTGSDGYIDRADADLRSYYLQGTHFGKKGVTRALVFGGKERTYQSWYGTPEARVKGDTAGIRVFADRNGLTARQRANLFNSGRRYNFYDYENQVDDYQQHHAQLHHSRQLTDSLVWNVALHYTRGLGFFEEFKEQDALSKYMRVQQPIFADIARRRWLDNHFAGFVTGAEWSNGNMRVVSGGGFNYYTNTHFGELIRVFDQPIQPDGSRYYENEAVKTDGNVYAKTIYTLNNGLSIYGDVQLRHVYYRYFGFLDAATPGYDNDRLVFLNPKAGAVWTPDVRSRFYVSFARGSKEPGREEYISSTPASRPRPEFLNNLEIGGERRFGRLALSVNLYAMEYRDQLIMTGQVNDVGAYVRRNVPESYRRGVEIMAALQLNQQWSWSTSATLSRNKIRVFTEYLDAYDADFNVLPQRQTVFRNTDIAFSPNTIVNNSIRYQKGRLSTEFLTKYVSRQYLDNRSDRNNSLEAYTATDIIVRYQTRRNGSIPAMTLSAQVANLFNSLYSSNGYTYGYIVAGETIRENFFYPQAGRHVLFQMQLAF